MTERSITHASFTLERVYPAAPPRVFNAFSNHAAKKKWFGGPQSDQWTQIEDTMDFRVGGRDRHVGKVKNGPKVEYYATYCDIVPDQRIVYSYDMLFDGNRVSVSLATVELTPDGKGTKLKLVEQGAFLDGYDDPNLREKGTVDLLTALGRSLEA
jgi:uncharacterized protein YndB with AHSA1/START domain